MSVAQIIQVKAKIILPSQIFEKIALDPENINLNLPIET